MKPRISISFAVVLTLAAGSAWAHHNMRAVYNINQRFTRTGTLTRVEWTNPHIHLAVEAKNEQGQVEKWSFEGPGPGNGSLRDRRADFERSMNKTVTVDASPARNGSLAGLVREIRLADGQVVSACPQNR